MHTRLGFGLIALAVVVGCGGNTQGTAPASTSPNGDEEREAPSTSTAPAQVSPSSTLDEGARGLERLDVTAADSITVGWNELGHQISCGHDQLRDYVKIDFAHARLQRLAWLRACDGDAGPEQGVDTLVVKADVALTSAQSASLLTTAISISLRKIDRCEGYDGKTFTLTHDRGDGSPQTYTDGISFGCDKIASGQDTLFHQASALVPGQQKEPSY